LFGFIRSIFSICDFSFLAQVLSFERLRRSIALAMLKESVF